MQDYRSRGIFSKEVVPVLLFELFLSPNTRINCSTDAATWHRFTYEVDYIALKRCKGWWNKILTLTYFNALFVLMNFVFRTFKEKRMVKKKSSVNRCFQTIRPYLVRINYATLWRNLYRAGLVSEINTLSMAQGQEDHSLHSDEIKNPSLSRE